MNIDSRRNSNVELLRVVLMTMIVIWHYIMHGLNMKDPSLYVNEWDNSLIFTSTFLSFHVDCFIFISGYFGLTLKKKKVIRLLLMLLTYSLFTQFVGFLIGYDMGIFTIAQAFFPISNNRWWFLTSYFYLLLLSPFLNSGVNILEKSTFRNILIILFFMFLGMVQWIFGSRFNDLNLFIFIYLLGRFIRKYPVNLINKHPFLIFGCSTAIMLALTVLSVWTKSGFLLYRIWYYHNPLVLISAISFFFMFYNSKELKIKVGYISSGVLATYLLTDSMYTQEWYNNLVVNNIPDFLWLFVAIITVALCSMFEFIRSKATDKLVNKIAQYI